MPFPGFCIDWDLIHSDVKYAVLVNTFNATSPRLSYPKESYGRYHVYQER